MLYFVIEIDNEFWSWAHLCHILHVWGSKFCNRYGTAINNFYKKKQKCKSKKKS